MTFSLVLLSSIVSMTIAFAPQQGLQYHARPSISTFQSSPRVQPPPESTGDVDIPKVHHVEDALSSVVGSTDLGSFDLATPVPLANDLGKEIFLSNIEEMRNTAKELMETETRHSHESKRAFQESLKSTFSHPSASQNAVAEPLDVSLTPTRKDVEAIMAISGEAVAAAEATLHTETNNDTNGPASKEGTNVSSLVVDTPPSLDVPKAPSVAKILKFAIPAIGVWLCGPLLSLIDTSSVGLLSGTTQQAALNPAVAVSDYAALLIAFMYTGTTNMMAAARGKDRSVAGYPRSTSTMIGALRLSTYVGTTLGAILFVFARPLLRALIGNDGISPAVFAAAMKYVRIRALGMPAAAVIGTAQAGCLGMQDIRTPLYVLGAAAVVNFMGDMLFVANKNPWIGGAAGAAWATTFSQYAALTFFMHRLCTKAKNTATPEVVNLSSAILELTGEPTSVGAARRRRFRDYLKSLKAKASRGKGSTKAVVTESKVRGGAAATDTDDESFSARGFLEGNFKPKDLVKLPSKETIDNFKPYVLPVTSTQVGRLSGYVAMSHVVSSSLGTVSMAAQQILVSLFYCLCPIADSLSLTAQSFVPSINEKDASHERSKALRKTLINFMKAGGVFGGVMALAVCSIPLLSGFFTADPSVISLVNMVAPLLVSWFGVHGFVCAAEGVLLGRKDLSFLGRMYAAYFALVPFFMLRVKRAALLGTPGINLSSIWKVFLVYQLSRFTFWTARSVIVQRRTDGEVPSNVSQ